MSTVHIRGMESATFRLNLVLRVTIMVIYSMVPTELAFACRGASQSCFEACTSLASAIKLLATTVGELPNVLGDSWEELPNDL